MSTEPVLSHHANGGAIYIDWSHDGDPYYYGECTECLWADSIDHRDERIAETALAEHKHLPKG